VAIIVNKLQILGAANTGGRSPKNFTLKACNDGSSWDVTLFNITNEASWGTSESRDWTISNTTAYRHHLLTITALDGSVDYAEITEILFWNGATQVSPQYMTAANAPSPWVIACSSEYAAPYTGWKVMDGNWGSPTLTVWDSDGTALPQWISFDDGVDGSTSVELKPSGSNSMTYPKDPTLCVSPRIERHTTFTMGELH
jgi:hypothetical protein